MAFGKADKILGNKVVSLVVLIPSPEKVPLNLLHSIRMLDRDPKWAEGISGEVLENRFDQSAFSCLTKGGTFLASKFHVESIYDAIPKRIQRSVAQRQAKIVGR